MFGLNIIDTASVGNSGLSAAKIAEVKASINFAAEIWGRHIDAPNAVIDIELTIDDIPGSALATAGAQYYSSGGAPFESRVTQELAADADISPGVKDGTLRIDLPNLMNSSFYFFDTSFEADPVGLTNSQFDFMSVMVHELAHVLGLSNPSNFTTPFGALVETIGGIDYFTGANAVAANGGNNVELTGSHLVSEDLLDPTTTSGERGLITAVHIGMWEDLGIPIVQATSGADTLWGFESNDDTINAAAGNDTIYGLTGDDTLNGSSGQDILIGGAGGDALNGGGGTDTASYADSVTGVLADLNNTNPNTGDADGDTYSSIENISGSSLDDELRGDNNANVIRGEDGDDTLLGRLGDDTFIGGDGEDFMSGGGGTDTADYSEETARIRLDMINNSANNYAAAGDVLVSIENLVGTDLNDALRGNGAVNLIEGGEGNDVFLGRGGNDTLDGGKDDDVLIGGSGVDKFIFRTGDGDDEIRDFRDNKETLIFINTGLQFSDLTVTAGATGAEIDYGSGTITMTGITVGRVTADDFDFI